MLDVFIHIPKTAGSSLRKVLAFNYSDNEQFMFNGCISEYVDFCCQLNVHKSNLKLVHGHHPYGVHQFISTDSTRYFTFLRNPLERFISDYIYSGNQSSGYYSARNDYALHDFIRSKSPFLENPQTKFLAGIHPEDSVDIDDEQLLNLAKNNLEHQLVFFGISEFFYESLLILAAEMDWKIPVFQSANVAGITENLIASLHDDLIQEINEKNSLDVQLYDYALDLFKKRMSKVNLNFWSAIRKLQFHLDNHVKLNKQVENEEFVIGEGELAFELIEDEYIDVFLESYNKQFWKLERDDIEIDNHHCTSVPLNYDNLLMKLKNEAEELFLLAEHRLQEIKVLKETVNKLEKGEK